MQGLCLQNVIVRPEKNCQALHPEALQDYSLIKIDIDRKAVGAFFGREVVSEIRLKTKTSVCGENLFLKPDLG